MIADMSKKKKEKLKKKIEELEKQIKELSKKASERDEFHDKYLRILAEYDNAKKRMERDINDFVVFANRKIVVDILPIVDSFDRARDVAKEHKHGAVFSEGLEMILRQLHKCLENNGVQRINTVGEKFDPRIHEAVTAVETEKYPEDVIAEEVSSGYTLNGKLIRAAKVKISKPTIKKGEE